MKKPIDMLIAIKKPWLEQISTQLSSLDLSWRPANRDLSKFWDLTTDAFLRQDAEGIESLLESWLETYFIAEMDTGKLTTDIHPILIPLLARFEQTCMHTASDLFGDGDCLRLYAAIVPQFNQFYDLAATLELGMYVHELKRREDTVKDEIQRLDETRSRFINTAAHELKTPLTLIEGYTEMLAETLQDQPSIPDHEILMQGIKTGTTKMRAIIDELIDISLVDNQMLSLYYQPVRVRELLVRTGEQFDDLIDEKSLEFEIHTMETVSTPTYADEERLMQALQHVVRNAIQYTPKGGSIEIDGRALPGFIEISCQDTGIGIAPQDQATIFEKFGRVPSSIARRDVGDSDDNSGTGLGLHLAKGILEAHGGTIWVESPVQDDEKYPGSTFHMMIPMREQAPDEHTIQRFGSLRTERAE